VRSLSRCAAVSFCALSSDRAHGFTFVLQASYKHENDRRDRVHGPVDHNKFVDTSELADRAPSFRYVP
jgi:hypothetical protein